MTGLKRDLSGSWRFLAANRGWTAVALASLALGIGANTLVFSIVESVLLRPFPYRNADELVLMWGSRSLDGDRPGFSGPDFQDWRDQSTALAEFGMFSGTTPMSPGTESPVPVSRIGPNVFDVLGVGPYLGRGFEAGDLAGDFAALVGGQEGRVVLSYGFWQSRYGGDPEALGRTLELNSAPYEIVGVMPPGFFFPEHNVELWVPLGLSPRLLGERRLSAFQGIGRLAAGVDLATAQAEIDVVNRRLDEEYPREETIAPVSTRRVAGLFPVREVAVSNYRLVLLTLLGAVGLVLLIACANVANLLLARSVARGKELALRATLGAGRMTLLRQLMTESLLLGMLAGILAVVLAFAGLRLVLGLGLVEIPRIQGSSINLTVLLFAGGISILTGLVSGLLPAWKASRVSLTEALKQGGQTSSQSGNSRLRDSLVVAEVALALVLLIGAGLMVRSSISLSRVNWGFEPEDLIVVSGRVTIRNLFGESQARAVEFVDGVLERLRRLPGIEAASAGVNVPLVQGGGVTISEHVVAEGAPITSAVTSSRAVIAPDYFKALGVAVRGREFDEGDHRQAQKVVVLSDALARELFPDLDPIDRTVHFATPKESLEGSEAFRVSLFDIGASLTRGSEDINNFEVTGETAHRVIGVAADQRMSSDLSAEPAGHTVYVDYRQVVLSPSGAGGPQAALAAALTNAALNSGGFLIRSGGSPQRLIESTKQIMLELNPEMSFTEAAPMESLVSRALGGAGQSQLFLVLSVAFGAVSLALAAAGIYGVMSHGVTERRYEIGIRLAIGAEPAHILGMVLKYGIRLASIGLAIGLAGAWAGSRLTESVLFGVTATDPLTFAAVTSFLLLIAVAASFIPARRAASVDPIVATRSE